MLIDLVAFTINLAVLNEPVMKDFNRRFGGFTHGATPAMLQSFCPAHGRLG